MITGINLVQTEDFVSKYDSGDPKTTWKLGVVDSLAMPVVTANQEQTLETMTMLVRFGVKGFDNLRGADGKEIRYSTEQKIYRGQVFHVLADSVIKIIPTPVILELGMRILEIGKLSEGETKN